ncbi:MAG: hypothetical protein K0Q74_735 [Gammaproteobacteria bacterium]|nr:hypothetical protein [Gammaproteobacteria bacterium]
MNIDSNSKKNDTASPPAYLLVRIRRLLITSVVILIVFLAVVVGISRSLFSYIDRYQTWFESTASQMTGQVVHIGKVQASWKTLHPAFVFNDVVVLDPSGKKKSYPYFSF